MTGAATSPGVGGAAAAGTGFGPRLAAATAARGPLCVGLDPHPALLDAWGLPDDPAGLERFARGTVDALAGEVALLKPQVAFFERHGAAGLAVLERVLADCRSAGVLCLADAKRGDIGSTAAGYADAWLGDDSPLAADAVTLSPYLGYGSLRPLVSRAAATGRGVFVLALTSNPEGAGVQHAVPPGSGGRSVAAAVVAAAAADNDALARPGDVVAGADDDAPTMPGDAGSVVARPGDAGPGDGHRPGVGEAVPPAVAVPPGPLVAAPPRVGPVGVVVGATLGDDVQATGVHLGQLRGHVLAPGVGAQGAGVVDARRVLVDRLGADPQLVVPSASREVLRAGPDAPGLRGAARRLADAAAEALGS